MSGYKKAAFSQGWWEEVELSLRRRVAAQEMMSLTVQGPLTMVTLASLFKHTPAHTNYNYTYMFTHTHVAPLAQTLMASELRDTTQAR